MDQGLVRGEDGRRRCPWGGPPEMGRYHDEEWGRPVVDDVRIFEKLSLEGFQSGLSWLTILRKREGFRKAFAGFEPRVVVGFKQRDVTRLLKDAAIVRNRAKIEAIINNAAATLEVQAQEGSLAALVWRFEPAKRPAPRALADLPALTEESTALSKELRKRGFRFVGPTTVYAAMQALGVVNDHLTGCYARNEVERERAAIVRPASPRLAP